MAAITPLSSLDFRLVYATGEHDPIELFIDGLMNSCQFDLALGYFRSTGFRVLAIGFADFIQRGGKMRFVINNTLYHKDKDAIVRGMSVAPHELMEQHVLDDLDELKQTLSKRDVHFFNCLSWLISSDRLEIRAVKPAKSKVGVVHHKFGVFEDLDGNQVVFNGSVNFSQYALKNNVESLWCDWSWEEGNTSRKRIDYMVSLFKKIWNGLFLLFRIISTFYPQLFTRNGGNK